MAKKIAPKTSEALTQITSPYIEMLDTDRERDLIRERVIPLFVAANWDKIEPLFKRQIAYCYLEGLAASAFFNSLLQQQLAAAYRRHNG